MANPRDTHTQTYNIEYGYASEPWRPRFHMLTPPFIMPKISKNHSQPILSFHKPALLTTSGMVSLLYHDLWLKHTAEIMAPTHKREKQSSLSQHKNSYKKTYVCIAHKTFMTEYPSNMLAWWLALSTTTCSPSIQFRNQNTSRKIKNTHHPSIYQVWFPPPKISVKNRHQLPPQNMFPFH